MAYSQEEILQIKINSASFDKDISALFAKNNTLNVKAKLVASSVTAMIKSFESLKATTKVKAAISNFKELETSLNAFEGKINADVLLNFDTVASQIEKFKPSKAIMLDAKLTTDSITAIKKDLKALQKDTDLFIKAILSQEPFKTVKTQLTEITKPEDKTINVKVEVDQTQLDKLSTDLQSLPESKTIKVNVDQSEVAPLIQNLNAIDKNTDVNLDVLVENEDLIKLQNDLVALPETKVVGISVEVDKTKLDQLDIQLKDVAKDRHVNFTVGIQEPKIDDKGGLSEELEQSVQKTIKKVQKGLNSYVTVATLSKYGKELKSTLDSLESSDETGLFNTAIEQLIEIEKRLDGIKSLDFEIPKVRPQKQKPINSLEETKQKLQIDDTSVTVSAKLDPTSLADIVTLIESTEASIGVDPVLKQLENVDLDPLKVDIIASLDQDISDKAITSLKTKVEASITELKTFISNGLQTAITAGFDVPGLTVEGSITLSGLNGVLQAVTALKQLDDFGSLGVNDELDKIIDKGKVIDAWVESTKSYSLQLGISINDLDAEDRAKLIADIQKRVGEVELYSSLALTADAISTIQAAIKAVELDNLNVGLEVDEEFLAAFKKEIKAKLSDSSVDVKLTLDEDEISQIKSKVTGIDLTPIPVEIEAQTNLLYEAIDKCIEDINKKTASLPIELLKDPIYADLKILIDHINSENASIQIGGDRTLIDKKLEEIKAYVKATEACLVLCLDDSKFLDELIKLKQQIADDVAKLPIQIDKVDTNKVSENVGAAVENAIKEISTEDLNKIKNEISSGKAQATNMEKKKNVDVPKVQDRLNFLKSARSSLEGTNNEKILGSLNETIERLAKQLGELPNDLESNFQLEIEKTEKEINKKSANSHEDKYGKTEKVFSKQVDMYSDMGMDASPQLNELVKQVARAVAVIKGLDDVWKDSMLPPVFSQGIHNNPAARGSVFNDGSGMILREDIASFLEDSEGVDTDAFMTVVHEMTHVMQQLAIKLGREIPYEKSPRTMEEAQAVVGMRKNPVYAAKNAKDGGHTFAIEEDANLTAMRHFASVAETMGIKLKDVIHPLKKLQAQLKAYDTIKSNSGKVTERYSQYFGQAGKNIAERESQDAAQQFKQLEQRAAKNAFSSFDMDAQYQMEDADIDYESLINAVNDLLGKATKRMRELQHSLKPSNPEKLSKEDRNLKKEELNSIIKERQQLNKQKLQLESQYKEQKENKPIRTIVETKQIEDPKIIEAQIDQLNAQKNNTDAKTQATTMASEQRRLNDEITRKLEAEKAIIDQQLIEAQTELVNLKKQNLVSAQAHTVTLRINQIKAQLLTIGKKQLELENQKIKLKGATKQLPNKITKSNIQVDQEKERLEKLKKQNIQEELKIQKLQNQLINQKQTTTNSTTPKQKQTTTPTNSTTPIQNQTTTPTNVAAPATNNASIYTNNAIPNQILAQEEKELEAARLAAKEAFKKARGYAAKNASTKERHEADADLQMKIFRVRKMEVDLALKKLVLAEKNATSFNRIEKARLDLEQANLRLTALDQRIIKSRLDNQIKTQRLALNNQRIKTGERKEAKDLAARAYGSTGGHRSQVNAERRLPINLGLNVLEASNNRLGNIARIFVDLQEGILGAAKEGEKFSQTLARVAVPIGIIGTIGAMTTLIGITVPTINAIQKLEKTLTAFGQQSDFSNSLALATNLATEYGASLQIVANELSKFKTSLADSAISDQANSIFSSLVAYGSTVGASQDELSRGLVALSQIASKGKVSLEELNGQLSEAIPGASSIAAKALGITKAEMFQMAAAGDLLSDEFLPKFRDELMKIDAAQKVLGKTTLSQAFAKLQQSLIISAIPATTNAVKILTSAFESLTAITKDGIPNPFSDSEQPLVKLSTILKTGLTLGFAYLSQVVFKLLPIQKALLLVWNASAYTTNKLTRNTAALSQAQEMSAISARSLGAALKGMALSVAPIIAMTAATSAFFAIMDAKRGQDMFAETNKNLKESAENITKLKNSVLKDLADLENAQNNGKLNPSNNPGRYNTISGEAQEQEPDQFKKKSWLKQFADNAIAQWENSRKSDSDPTKVKPKNNYSGYSSLTQEDASKIRLNYQEGLGTSNIDSIIKDAKAQREALDSVLKAKQGYNKEQIKKDVIKLEGVQDTISSFGTLQKAFSDGKIGANSLKSSLMEIGVPSNLIPPEIGDPLATTEEKAKALEEVLVGLNESAENLNMGIGADDLEKVKLRIDDIKTALSEVNYDTPKWKELNAELKASQAQYRDVAGALENTAKSQSKVNQALIAYQSIKAENEGTVELATVLSEVALKEEALNSGIIKRSQLERSFQSIKARGFTARMAQIKAEKIAMDALTVNLDKRDAFEIKIATGDPKLFRKNNDKEKTINFAIDRATVSQLDQILIKTEGKISESAKKSIETYRAEVSNLNLAYAQQQSGLQDIELDIREKASTITKEVETAMEDVGKQMKEATADFVKSFTDALKDINREITSLGNDLAKLKINNASKQFNNALKRFALNAETELDEGILENIRLRNQMQTDNALADVDFKSESERIAASFADGVSEINQAFADYLAEFKKLQNDLIKARQEKAKADQEAALALADLKGSALKPNLGYFDLNKSQLNQGVGKSMKENDIPDSEKLLEADQKIGEENKKQTELAQKQLTAQSVGNASIDVQTATMVSGNTSIVDAINNQNGAEIDFSNLDVFNAQLAVLVQVRDILSQNESMDLDKSGSGVPSSQFPEWSKQEVVSQVLSSVKSSYEGRDAAINRMNEAIDRFASGEGVEGAIEQFASAQKAILEFETKIRNLETSLENEGINLGKPKFDTEKDSAVKDAIIAPGKKVVSSKYGQGVFDTHDREAEDAAKNQTLMQNQTKYGTTSGIPLPVLEKLSKAIGYLKPEQLAKMSYNEVSYESAKTGLGNTKTGISRLERYLAEFEGQARSGDPVVLDKVLPTKGEKSGVPTSILNLMTKFYNKQGYKDVNSQMLDNLDPKSLNALAKDANIDLTQSVQSLDKTISETDISNASPDVKALINQKTTQLGVRRDAELIIRDENKKGTQLDNESTQLEIDSNSKKGSKIENLDELKKILDESKIDEKSLEERAKTNLSENFVKLDKYSEVLKTTEKQIAAKQATLNALNAGTFKDGNGKLVEGDSRQAAIVDTQNQISALQTNETYLAVKKLEQAEKDRLEPMKQQEMFALSQLDILEKQIQNGKIQQGIDESKQDLEDPNINPVQKIELERNVKVGEQALSFGDDVKAKYDEILKTSPGMAHAEAFRQAQEEIQKVNNADLSNLEASADSVKNKIKSSFTEAFTSILSIDFTDTSKTLSEKIFGVFDGILKSVQSWAAGKLGDVLSGLLSKGSSDPSKGNPAASALSTGLGAAAGAAGGGWAGIAASVIGAIFADGGEVGQTASQNSIAKLMETERIRSNGKMPVLAALHVGEHVLSTKNKDAQAFQAISQSGVWDAIKSASGYANGGGVGNAMKMNQLFNSTSSQSKTINNISNFSFNASNDQLIQRTESQIKAKRNNFL